MTWVATAIIGGAVIGTIGTTIASSKASNAAVQAANIQSNSANQAAAIQQQMYGQTRNDLAPFRAVGQGAISYANSLIPGGLQVPGTGPAQTQPRLPAGLPPGPIGGQVTYDENGFPIPAEEGGGQPSYSIPNEEGGGGAVGTPGEAMPGAGQSPFLSGVQNNLPGGGSLAQNALTAYTPGNGANPLQAGVNSFIPGQAHDTSSASSQWDALSASQNSILGGSPNPNAALSNLISFTPDGGSPDVKKLNMLLGLDDSDPEARQRALAATPGYQFALDQGLKATQNGFAAQGLASSGAAMKGAAQFATGLADQTYQSQLNNYLSNYNSKFQNAYNLQNSTATQAQNAYSNQGNLGLNALNQGTVNALNIAGQNFSNANTAYTGQVNNAQNLLALGSNAGAQTGTIGVQSAANQGNYLTSGAAAQAGGIVGSANASANALTGITNNISNAGVNAALFRAQAPAIAPTTNALTNFNTGFNSGLYD